jgi:hypothetical protein
MVTENPVVETVSGTVGRVNQSGFTLAGREGWLNVSKYASPAPSVPREGTQVRVGLDKSGFVRTVEIVPSSDGAESAAPTSVIDRDIRIMRQAVINSAIAILSSGGRAVEDPNAVLEVAEQLEAWVTR